MSLIGIATGHYERMGRQSIEIPEWVDEGNKPVVIYFAPITVAEQTNFYNEQERNKSKAFANLVVKKALSSEGENLFKPQDVNALQKGVSGKILLRIANAMLGVGQANGDEGED